MSHEIDVQNKLVKVVPLSNILSLNSQNMSCNWKITRCKGLIGILLIVNYFENSWSNNPSSLQLDVISYKYWLHESLTSEIAPRENQCWPRRSRDWYSFLRGDNISFSTVNNYWIILNINIMRRLCYVRLKKISEIVLRMVKCTLINSAHSIFFGISPVFKQFYPLPSSITS